MRHDSTDILILDKDNPNFISRFNGQGQLLNLIGSVGNLHGDIPSISTFIIHDSLVEILSPYGDRSRVYRYSKQGNPIAQEDVNALGLSFERFENGNYLFYNSYNFPHEKWRLQEVKNSSVVQQYFKNDYKGVKFPIFENNIFSFDKKSLLFFESFNPNIFRISSGNTPTREYTINAGRHSISSGFWDKHIIDGFSEIMKEGFYNIFNILENQMYVLIDLRFQNEDGALKSLQLFVNKESGEIQKLAADVANHDIYGFPVILTESNQIGYLMNPARFLEAIKGGQLTYSKNDKKVNNEWDIYDNPVIGFVSLN